MPTDKKIVNSSGFFDGGLAAWHAAPLTLK